jgi:hypothetical protein
MRILALWAHPRARSSAFARMMCERGDFRVLDEPFMRYYYFSDERISPRRPDVEPQANARFEAVLENVLYEAEKQPVFIKDHAYHVALRADPAFLRHFHNTFLIRHPAQALPSLHARMPDFSLPETGYAESVRLVDLVKQLGGVPVIIDADDLVENPEGTVRAYCEAVEIPFLHRALHWERGLPADMCADWGGWYSHLEKSCGFARQVNPAHVAVEGDEHLRRAYEYCLPYYRKLHEQRLSVP